MQHDHESFLDFEEHCVEIQTTFGSVSFSMQGGDCGITGKNDADDFLRLLAAMEILHFTPEDQSAIFRVLSSILHLGNVYFQRHEVEIQAILITMHIM